MAERCARAVASAALALRSWTCRVPLLRSIQMRSRPVCSPGSERRSGGRSRWSSRPTPAIGRRRASCSPRSCRTAGSRTGSISGVPGAGKSTFLDAIGMRLIDTATARVLAVDRTAAHRRQHLGDKTGWRAPAAARVHPAVPQRRLARRCRGRNARRSSSSRQPARHRVRRDRRHRQSRDAGGQGRHVPVASLARTGDSLQGIKKGVLEFRRRRGQQGRRRPRQARPLLHPSWLRRCASSPQTAHWTTPVLSCSGHRRRPRRLAAAGRPPPSSSARGSS